MGLESYVYYFIKKDSIQSFKYILSDFYLSRLFFIITEHSREFFEYRKILHDFQYIFSKALNFKPISKKT